MNLQSPPSLVKEFILEHLDNLQLKNLGILMENFEEWEYNTNPDIDDETYLVAFLATYLSRRFLMIPPPLFNRKPSLWFWRWSRASDIVWLSRIWHGLIDLRGFQGDIWTVTRTYGPRGLVLGWLGCYFPKFIIPSHDRPV